MATVGNLASTQLRMAQVSAKHGVGSSSLYSTTLNSSRLASQKAASDGLNNLMNTALKGKSDYFKAQYSGLYKSIYGITDGSEGAKDAESTVSLKTAATDTERTAGSLTRFANSLSYGKDYDTKEYSEMAEKFAKSYNQMIDGTADSQKQSVLQKGVVMVNTAKVYSSALKRAGFTVGSDNKLTFDKESLGDVSASDIKTTFGSYGFTEKAAQKARQINSLSGSAGAFGYNSSSMSNYAYSIGALLNMYA